jgi:prenyltransferase beta subunit
VAIGRLTNILSAELTNGTADWIAQCQTYEGGLGGEPGLEAHGGYTFCGAATLNLLGRLDRLQLGPLMHWLTSCQKRLEGGFHGRTNKLVDGCYSFWQGSTFAVVDSAVREQLRAPPSALLAELEASDGHWLYNQAALQEYLLICGQRECGGMCDKPGKEPDFYHTCYCLSGLSVAQHSSRAASSREAAATAGAADELDPALAPFGEPTLLVRCERGSPVALCATARKLTLRPHPHPCPSRRTARRALACNDAGRSGSILGSTSPKRRWRVRGASSLRSRTLPQAAPAFRPRPRPPCLCSPAA